MEIIRAAMLAVLAAALLPAAVHAQLTDAKKAAFTDIEYNALRVAPEKYRGKKVAFTARFINFSTTFFPYMEKAGITSGRHLGLIIGDLSLPTIARKDKEIEAQAAELKPGTTVKVYGKVNRFTAEPHETTLPRYYISLEQLEVIETPEQEAERRFQGLQNQMQQRQGQQGNPAMRPGGGPGRPGARFRQQGQEAAAPAETPVPPAGEGIPR